MSRKTGRDTRIEIEVGNTFYAMGALSTVSSPAASVGKKYTTNATFLSDREELQPDVRLDGVISGFNISPGSGYNQVSVSQGDVYIKGQKITVSGVNVDNLLRPVSVGQVRVTALTVDSSGNINKTVATAGAASTTRGVAGGKPYLPTDEVLIGYVNMAYYDGSVSGAAVIESSEIDDESKERTIIPSYSVIHYDGDAEKVGCIEFASALPLIHAATWAGPGSARRNVYASYYGADFEELPDAKDFSCAEDVSTSQSMAYRDASKETSVGTPSWSGSGTCYWSKVGDVLDLVKNSKRWVKYYPDGDETDYHAGRAVIKISRDLPTESELVATVTLEGSGKLWPIT